jgi:hypothetical protein
MMKSTTITYAIIGLIALIGYNAFLIKRDEKMFKKYYANQSEYCRQIGCENEKLH